MDTDTAQFRYLDASRVSAGIIVFHPTADLTSGSDRKALQAVRLIKSNFRRRFRCVVTSKEMGVEIECRDVDEHAILRACDVIDDKLQRLRDELLTAKMVEEILLVSASELRQWTKDGRIRPHGRAFFRQGQKEVGLFVYLPADIRLLAGRPDQIEQWRKQDRLQPAPLAR
jgi:hypothetical protein